MDSKQFKEAFEAQQVTLKNLNIKLLSEGGMTKAAIKNINKKLQKA